MGFNKNFILKGLFVFVLLMSVFLGVGNTFRNSDRITLDESSIDYLDEFSDMMDSSGFNNLTKENTLSSQGILEDATDDGEQSTSDIFATINYYKSRLSNIVSYFKIFINLPTFSIRSIGLPLEPFTAFSNLIGVFVYTVLILIFIRLMRGS